MTTELCNNDYSSNIDINNDKPTEEINREKIISELADLKTSMEREKLYKKIGDSIKELETKNGEFIDQKKFWLPLKQEIRNIFKSEQPEINKQDRIKKLVFLVENIVQKLEIAMQKCELNDQEKEQLKQTIEGFKYDIEAERIITTFQTLIINDNKYSPYYSRRRFDKASNDRSISEFFRESQIDLGIDDTPITGEYTRYQYGTSPFVENKEYNFPSRNEFSYSNISKEIYFSPNGSFRGNSEHILVDESGDLKILYMLSIFKRLNKYHDSGTLKSALKYINKEFGGNNKLIGLLIEVWGNKIIVYNEKEKKFPNELKKMLGENSWADTLIFKPIRHGDLEHR